MFNNKNFELEMILDLKLFELWIKNNFFKKFFHVKSNSRNFFKNNFSLKINSPISN